MSDYLLNEIDLDGYQVVRSQYFQKQAEPILTLCSNAMAEDAALDGRVLFHEAEVESVKVESVFCPEHRD